MIPHSDALKEAEPLSLNELMSANPEDPMFLQNLPRIVQLLREQAERFAKAEAEGKKPKKAVAASGSNVSVAKSTELDF